MKMYTPLELDQLEFSKKGFGGYRAEDVDQIFEVLKRDYEQLYKENLDLKKKLREATESVEKYSTMEETLQNTLVMAQRNYDETRGRAEAEAKNIIDKAKNEAAEIARVSAEEAARLSYKKEELKKDFTVFATKISNLLAAEMELLKHYANEEE